jgi:hypothetical protein
MNKFATAAIAVTTILAFTAPAFAQSNCLRLCGYERSDDNCGDQLGYLKRVSKGEVAGVDDHYRVWVTEFCLNSDLMRSDGNATYLRTTIAQTDVLVDMLEQKGYFPEDVIAVKMMGDDTINLFVHNFDGSSTTSLLSGGGGPVAMAK